MTLDSTTHEVQRMQRDVARIITTAATFFDVPVEHLISRKRHEPLATQRQIVMALCEELTPASQTDVARAFCRNTHGTIGWAIQAARAKLEQDDRLQERVTVLREKCAAAIAVP